MRRYRIGTYQLMVEQYAKKNSITVAKAIIHFMNKDAKKENANEHRRFNKMGD